MEEIRIGKRWNLIRGWLCLMACLVSFGGFSQSHFPYQLSGKTDGLLAGGIAAVATGDLLLGRNLIPFTPADLTGLDAEAIFGPDRFVTKLYSPAARTRSDIGFYGSAVSGLAGSLLTAGSLNKSSRFEDIATVAVMWAETNLATNFGTNMVKALVVRTRPFAYNPDAPEELKLEVDARKSFFSGHTSLTACNTFFAAKVFADTYPNSRWKPAVWGAAALVPAWVGTERILAGKHFPTDVLAGYAFGALLGIAVPQLHKIAPSGHRSAGRQFQLFPVSTLHGVGAGIRIGF